MLVVRRRFWPAMLFLFLKISCAYAGTIIVNTGEDTNTRDSEITLREAILLSEGSLEFHTLTPAEQTQVSPPLGRMIADTINFSVSGAITPASSLPDITDDGTVIDASSRWSGIWPGGQPGIVLDGTSAGTAWGLAITGASNCKVLGLFITNFHSHGILINAGAKFNTVGGKASGNRNVISGNDDFGIGIFDSGTDGNVVSGNYIGTDATGTADRGNSKVGVGIGSGAQSNTVGGSTSVERNIISGNDIFGIWIAAGPGTENNVVIGNFIGTDVTGTKSLGNSSDGVWIAEGARSNTIGGKTPEERNIISGNHGSGVGIFGSGTDNNIVSGNYIGTDVTGTADLGNVFDGVVIGEGARSNIVGGIATGEGNTIAFNNQTGVVVRGNSTHFNRISGNSIRDNGGPGIDLADGGNDEIRPPDVIWASLAGDILTIFGDTAGANAMLEVFEADSSRLEGQTFLGNLAADGNGEFSGSLFGAGKGLSVGDSIVVTTTHDNGNTSEFNPPLAVSAAPPPVPVGIDGRKLSVGEGGILYYDGRPFRAIGVNYSDVFERVLIDPDNTTYRHGLAQLAAHRIPFARFMIGYWPSQLAMYDSDREDFLQRLDGVIQAAEEYGIGLIPSLFWANFSVPDLVGEPRNQWGNPNSKTIAFMRRYTRDIVSRYNNSPAIWAWEFGNEYNLEVTRPWAAPEVRPPIVPELGTPSKRGPADDLTFDMIITAFREFAQVVRSVDPTRPITTGDSIPNNYAEGIRLGGSTLDTRDDFKAHLSLVTPSPCDMISIHLYPEVMYHDRFEPDYIPSYSELISLSAEAGAQNGKALFVGEFGANDIEHGGPNPAARRNQEMLEALVENNVALAAIWVYDRIVSDDASTQGWNITATNSRSYLLHAIRDANRDISNGLFEVSINYYPWDVNRDGKVDVWDIILVGQRFGENIPAPSYPNPDVNGDGTVNILDIIVVGKHFGEVYFPAAPSMDIWEVDVESASIKSTQMILQRQRR